MQSFFAELEKSNVSQKEHIEKRMTVQANSMEELLKKIQKTKRDAVQTVKVPETGRKFDFSI